MTSRTACAIRADTVPAGGSAVTAIAPIHRCGNANRRGFRAIGERVWTFTDAGIAGGGRQARRSALSAIAIVSGEIGAIAGPNVAVCFR